MLGARDDEAQDRTHPREAGNERQSPRHWDLAVDEFLPVPRGKDAGCSC